MAEALAVVALWICGAAAVVLLPAWGVTRHFDLLAFGSYGVLVAAIGLFQLVRRRPRPLVLLMVGSFGLALFSPFVGQPAQLVIAATYTVLIVSAVLTLPGRQASWFTLWCAVLVAVSVPWLLAGAAVLEIAASTGLLLAISAAVWWLVRVAVDLMTQVQQRHRVLFDASPVATLEEDFTEVARSLEQLRRQGINDLQRHLSDKPAEVRRLVAMIRIRQANLAAVRMIGAESSEELMGSLQEVYRSDSELAPFVEQFLAIWDGRAEVALDLAGMTIDGEALEAVLHWSVPTNSGKQDLGRVIVTISDITPRRVVEDQLAAALATNQQLLAFEQALSSCSRTLLLGKDEDAIDVALETLREAIGADRAYLTINETDPELGLASRVMNSTSIPEHSEDPWMGKVIPWSKYPMSYEPNSRGEPFQHVATDGSLNGWSRSILSVPMFVGGDWIGNVGFMDITRRTRWSQEAVRMLQVAAPMLGNFWERDVTRRRLEDLVKSKDRFIASVSHELRTPLSAVVGFAAELRDGADGFQPEEMTGMLQLIAEQSQEMANMVEDLLVSARADIGTISMIPQDVYLRSQAEATVAGLGSTGSTTITVLGGPGKVWADPSRTRQILRNLLTNAIRYGGSQVIVEASEGCGHTVLRVWDSGLGLPESQWERIFEPYERAHDTPTQPASIGLGLTVSRQLAHLMGGDLTYRSDDSSSVFELTLPAEKPETIEPLANELIGSN